MPRYDGGLGLCPQRLGRQYERRTRYLGCHHRHRIPGRRRRRAARSERKISGLTTAASIWVTAALGIVCGIGAWEIAAISTVLLLLLLSVGGRIEKALHRRWLSKSPEEQAAIARHEE
jgi:hypothetical protein